MVLNMGPQHPSTHGVLRLVARNRRRNRPAPRSRHRLSPHRHRENLRSQVLPASGSADRPHRLPQSDVEQSLLLPGGRETSPAGNSAPRAIPARAAERAHPHPVAPGMAGHACHGHRGADPLPLHLPRARRDPQNLRACQRPAHDGLLFPHRGSSALEPPVDFFERVQNLVKIMPEKIDEYENLLNGNPIWVSRLKGVGYLSAADAVALGVTGPPVARQRSRLGSASRHAVLRLREVSVQGALSPTVGDVWTRYTLRVQEMRESVKICQQALDGMPDRPA